MIIPTSISHCPSNRVNPYRTAQLSVQRVNTQGSLVTTSQTTQSLVHWLLQFNPVSIQIVSVSNGIVTIVHGDGSPQLYPSVYQVLMRISPTPSLQSAGATTGLVLGSHEKSRSLHQHFRVLKVYIEMLAS